MTVKAEDRPSGSAGDSASVSTPLFRISVELSLRGVCLSRASEASPLVSRLSHIFMDTINSALFIYYDSSFIDGWKYDFFSLDYSVKIC